MFTPIFMERSLSDVPSGRRPILRVRTMSEARLQIPLAPFGEVAALERELGCSNAVAQVLVRRGFSDADHARAWLAGAEEHALSDFEGIDGAVEVIRRHIAAGSRLVVHGD